MVTDRCERRRIGRFTDREVVTRMRHSTELSQEHPSPRTAQLACRLAVLALLTLAATASGQEGAPVPAPTPTVAPSAEPLVPNVAYAPGQYAKIEGTIVSRKGDALLVRRQNTQELSVVTLTERTDIESPSGVLNLERKRQDMAKLQAGLFLKIRGHGGDQKELVAERISFHKGALKVTNQISSGQVELKEDQEAMAAKLNMTRDSLSAAKSRANTEFSSVNSRITDIGSYATKYSGTVYFSTGSATLSDEAKMTLDLAVSNNKSLNGSIVALSGFADSRGNPESNQRLSQRRVDAVVAYLTQDQSVPPVKIYNPTGMGTSHPAGDNDTAEGRALNRRVEIKVLVNKGINPSDSSKP